MIFRTARAHERGDARRPEESRNLLASRIAVADKKS